MARNDYEDDLNVSYFRYCRDHQGNLVPVDVARRNDRRVPRFPPSITEPAAAPDDEESEDFRELVEEVTRELTPTQRRRFLRLADGVSVMDLAEEENVTRPAIYDSIKRMICRGPYCAISAIHGVLRKHINQHV